MELYEAVLKTNWTREGLERLVLVGNSLIEYLDRSVRVRFSRVAEDTDLMGLVSRVKHSRRTFPTFIRSVSRFYLHVTPFRRQSKFRSAPSLIAFPPTFEAMADGIQQHMSAIP